MNRSALRLPTFVLFLSLAGLIATEITRAETSKTIENYRLHMFDEPFRSLAIRAYNHHVRLLPPEPLVVKQPKSTRVEGADIVMKSSCS